MILRGRGRLEPADLALDASTPADGATAAHRVDGRARASLSRRADLALRLAAARGAVTRGDLASACGISGERARQELVALVHRGLLARLGAGRAARYVLP